MERILRSKILAYLLKILTVKFGFKASVATALLAAGYLFVSLIGGEEPADIFPLLEKMYGPSSSLETLPGPLTVETVRLGPRMFD